MVKISLELAWKLAGRPWETRELKGPSGNAGKKAGAGGRVSIPWSLDPARANVPGF